MTFPRKEARIKTLSLRVTLAEEVMLGDIARRAGHKSMDEFLRAIVLEHVGKTRLQLELTIPENGAADANS